MTFEHYKLAVRAIDITAFAFIFARFLLSLYRIWCWRRGVWPRWTGKEPKSWRLFE